ncbi:hypothetical protein ACH3O9_06400 [Leeuwenhoekiella sp. A16]|tara:strand:- start:190 stop:339 length:150 start_codon:yes stop_codon:yes gene_type:complete
MEWIQNALVLLIFLAAAGYLVTKFIWKPAFLGGNSSKKGGCGKDDCGCH